MSHRVASGCWGSIRRSVERLISSDDAEPGARPVAILTHELWTSRLASDSNIIGRELRLNGRTVTVVGVMPPGYELPLTKAGIILPLQWNAADRRERRIAKYLVIGRLRADLSFASAETRLDSLARALEQQYPESNKDSGILLRPLKEEVIGTVRPVLLAIFCGTLCVLLLACLNLANLFGCRSVRRQREMAIRASLSAGRPRLVRQLLTEGLTLAAAGSVVGVIWGTWAVRVFIGWFNDSIYFSLPRRSSIGLDGRVLAFTAVACIMSGILFSIAPAWRAGNARLASSMTRSARRARLGTVLLGVEVSFSLALVVAAGGLVHSYSLLRAQAPGFSSTGVLTATVALPPARYDSPLRQFEFFRRLVAAVSAIPGAKASAAVRFLPMSGVASVWDVSVPGGLENGCQPRFTTL